MVRSCDKECKLLFMQRFKIILEYLRAAHDQQTFLVPTNLEDWELANLAAEAQYYGLAALHESLQAAANATKPCTYQYKHILCYEKYLDIAKESELQALYDEGWELMGSSIAGTYTGMSTCWLVLRLLR